MADVAAVLKELQQERGRLDDATAVLRKLAGKTYASTGRVKRRPKMSLPARRKIAAAQRARWAKWKAKRRKKAA